MAKRPTNDGSGDNDELQALFDSIADEATKPKPAPRVSDASGDNSELQNLFDSVSQQYEAGHNVIEGQAREVREAPAESSVRSSEEKRQEAVFNKIGQMTRLLHDTLRELGWDKMLEETARQLPDAKQRLSYIATMTEQAASRVLNATDIAKPIQDKVEERAKALNARWAKLYAKELSVSDFKALAGDTKEFLGVVVDDSKVVNDQLMEIMMAQDFQDLTGQVIKKIVDMAGTLETELLSVLIEVMPESKRQANESLLNGPVVGHEGHEDVVTNQEQVDDLLESLGF